MVNDLVDAIAVRLGELFEGVEVYRDEIEQGFHAPCFFILPLRIAQEAKLGNRYFRKHSFDVHYFPIRDESSVEVQEVATVLLMGLEYILAAGDLIRASRMEYEAHDGVLHFTVDYDVFILREREKVPYMETLTQRQKTKGEEDGREKAHR